MSKKKATLKDLKLNSFVTSLEGDQMENVKGGFIKIRGHRYVYNVRWTSVDTRTNADEITIGKKGK